MDLLLLFFIGFTAALTPGPDIFYIVSQGLCNGRKSALLATLGILSGNLIYLLLVFFGLWKIGQNPYFQIVVGLLGGIYLIKIAIQLFKATPTLQIGCQNDGSTYLQALLINLSNPKALIFFAIIITPYLGNLASFLALFTGIASAFFSAALASSKIELEERLLALINKIAALLFILFAMKLFYLSYEVLMS